jgi:hypothetical protein
MVGHNRLADVPHLRQASLRQPPMQVLGRRAPPVKCTPLASCLMSTEDAQHHRQAPACTVGVWIPWDLYETSGKPPTDWGEGAHNHPEHRHSSGHTL